MASAAVATPHRVSTPRVGDLLLAAVLAALLVLGSIGESDPLNPADRLPGGQPPPHPGAAAYVLVAVSGLAIAGYRRWPLPILVVSLAAAVGYSALGYVNGAVIVAPLVALYFFATRAPWRTGVVAGLATMLLLVGVTAWLGPFGPTDGPVRVIPFAVVAVVATAMAVANRRAYVDAIRDRADQAERTREEEARRRVAAERLRIARELHDVVAHNISMVNVQARVAEQVIADPPAEGAAAIAAIKQASRDALVELRHILGLLRESGDSEPTDPVPGLAQVGRLLETSRRGGLSPHLSVEGVSFPLPTGVDLAAYRILQEALTNAARHAPGAVVEVRIGYQDDGVCLEVADDGARTPAMPPAMPTAMPPAMPSAMPASGSGYGIAGMRERALAVGGTFEAGPRPGDGFAVSAWLPVKRAR